MPTAEKFVSKFPFIDISTHLEDITNYLEDIKTFLEVIDIQFEDIITQL